MKTATASTLQDETYDTLRHWLMLGRWLPGERLKIKHLADEMGVSQMPVRAALQRLAAEKALVNIPNCGVAVPQLTVSIKYPISGPGHDLRLASGSVHTAHGDFFNGWVPAALEREIRSCIRRGVVCDLASNRSEEDLFQAS